MKKHLIAAGVVAAFAAPAMAQNVSVYGIVDVNYQYQDVDNGTGNTAMSQSGLATSRLGFRGSEDLGGGLKAEFQLEGKLVNSDGQVGTTSTDTLFDRESWVGLSGAFGAIRLGLSDVSDSVNIDAKVSQIGDFGLITELSTDKKKVIRYTTPNFNGLSAQVGYASPDSSVSSVTGAVTEATNNSISNLYIAYEKGPLGVYAGFENKKISASYDQSQTNIGAKYDFGAFSVGLVYSTRDGVGTGSTSAPYNAAAASGDKDYKQYVLSVAAPLGNGFKAHAAYQNRDLGGADTSLADFRTITLAVTKAMSKRTTAYGAIVDKSYDLTSDPDNKTVILGVTHSF